MEPITRKERILSGDDIEPITRLEYFLKEAAGGGGGGGGGGSSLPSYTSADKGKVLTIGEGSSSTTEVIVPEQNVTTAYSSYATKYMAPVEIDDVSQPSADYTYTMTINGTDYPVVINGWQYWTSDHEYIISPNPPDMTSWIFVVSNAEAAGTYTVSLTRSVPSVEPKWEAASGGATVITIGQRTGSGNVADYAFYENGTEVVGYDNCAAILSAIGDAPIIVDASGAKCTVVQKDSSSVLFFFSDDYSTATLKSAGFVEDFH